jgi:FAD synthase
MYKPAAAWCENGPNFSFQNQENYEEGRIFMKLSFIPLLMTGKTISTEVRQALREKRLKDAAAMLMQQYGLSCLEAGDLLDIPLCD